MFDFFKRGMAIGALARVISEQMRVNANMLVRTDPEFNQQYQWIYFFTRIGDLVTLGRIENPIIREKDTPLVMDQIFSSIGGGEIKKRILEIVKSMAANSPSDFNLAVAAAHRYTEFLTGIRDISAEISADDNHREIFALVGEHRKMGDVLDYIDKKAGRHPADEQPSYEEELLAAYDSFHMFGSRAKDRG